MSHHGRRRQCGFHRLPRLGHHADGGGCQVLTEKTQQGPFFLETVGRQDPGLLYRYHQKWVEALARAAEEDHRAQA